MLFLALLPKYAIEFYESYSHFNDDYEYNFEESITLNWIELLFRVLFVVYRVYSDRYLLKNLSPCRKKPKNKTYDMYKGKSINAFLNSTSNIDYV